MRNYFMAAAASALAVFSFSTPAVAQAVSTSGGMTAEEHQRMMSGEAMSGQGEMMSDPDMHRQMMAMMERCDEMMGKKGKRISSAEWSTKKTSVEGKWAWQPNSKQAPGPRAPLLPPIRAWVPAERSPAA